MFALKTIIYLGVFAFLTFRSLTFHPIMGVLLYLGVYFLSPMGRWWGENLSQMGFRHSLFAAAAVILGAMAHKAQLRTRNLLVGQERLLLAFLAVIWISLPLGVPVEGVVTNAEKMTKLALILLVSSHVVTRLKYYNWVVLVLMVGGLFMGYNAFTAESWQFRTGRLDAGIGGNDFGDSNFSAAVMAAILPFCAVVFFRYKDWKYRLAASGIAVLLLNGMIMCRSRGAFVGLALGMASSLFFSFKGRRMQMLLVLAVVSAAGLYLVDPGFVNRMDSITTEGDEIDWSSQSRILAWTAAVEMFMDHPLGIGEGRFTALVGSYNPDILGRDTHNTYFRCLAELGLPGTILFGLLILNAFRYLARINRWALGLPEGQTRTDYLWNVLSLRIALVILLGCGITMTFTYVECFYWFLMMPVFLWRSMEHTVAAGAQEALEASPAPAWRGVDGSEAADSPGRV